MNFRRRTGRRRHPGRGTSHAGRGPAAGTAVRAPGLTRPRRAGELAVRGRGRRPGAGAAGPQGRAAAAGAPGLLRGQSVGVPLASRFRGALCALAQPIDHGWPATLSRPQFFTVNVDRLPHAAPAAWRRRGTPVLGWTVRTVEALQAVAALVDNVIVEGEAARAACAWPS